MEKKITSQIDSDKQSCEDKKAEASVVLQDIKVMTRDVTDFTRAKQLKKNISQFEEQVDEMCKK